MIKDDDQMPREPESDDWLDKLLRADANRADPGVDSAFTEQVLAQLSARSPLDHWQIARCALAGIGTAITALLLIEERDSLALALTHSAPALVSTLAIFLTLATLSWMSFEYASD